MDHGRGRGTKQMKHSELPQQLPSRYVNDDDGEGSPHRLMLFLATGPPSAQNELYTMDEEEAQRQVNHSITPT